MSKNLTTTNDIKLFNLLGNANEPKKEENTPLHSPALATTRSMKALGNQKRNAFRKSLDNRNDIPSDLNTVERSNSGIPSSSFYSKKPGVEPVQLGFHNDGRNRKRSDVISIDDDIDTKKRRIQGKWEFGDRYCPVVLISSFMFNGDGSSVYVHDEELDGNLLMKFDKTSASVALADYIQFEIRGIKSVEMIPVQDIRSKTSQLAIRFTSIDFIDSSKFGSFIRNNQNYICAVLKPNFCSVDMINSKFQELRPEYATLIPGRVRSTRNSSKTSEYFVKSLDFNAPRRSFPSTKEMDEDFENTSEKTMISKRKREPSVEAVLEPVTIEIPDSPEQEEHKIERKLRSNIHSEALFKYPFDGHDCVTIYEHDVERLNEGQFLDDSIIEFYLKYLKQKNKLTKHVHIFNTFFYKKLTGNQTRSRRQTMVSQNAECNITGFMRVKKWLKKADIFNSDFLLIPINESAHWFLAIVAFPKNILKDKEKEILEISEEEDEEGTHSIEVISNVSSSLEVVVPIASKKKSSPDKKALQLAKLKQLEKDKEKKIFIIICDSLGIERRATITNLKNLLVEAAIDSKPELESVDLKSRIFGFNAKLPVQPNHCDCGVYLLKYAELFLENPHNVWIQMVSKALELKKWFSLNEISQMRIDIRNLISDTHDEYQLYKAKEESLKKPNEAAIHDDSGSASEDFVEVETETPMMNSQELPNAFRMLGELRRKYSNVMKTPKECKYDK